MNLYPNMVKIRADFHNHLRTGSRSHNSDFNQVVDLVSERLGVNGILGVVNFGRKVYEDFAGLKGYERYYMGENDNGIYVPEKKVLIVKGQEVPTQEGHILALGLGKNVHLKMYKSLIDTLNEAKDKGAVVVADHPFYLQGLGNYLKTNHSILNDFDAVEIFNGEAAFGIPGTSLTYVANQKARDFFNQVKINFPHLGALASSDGHSSYELGKSWTEIDALDLDNKSNFLNSLKKSIRNTNIQTPRSEQNALFGAVTHLGKLAFITKLAQKIGLESFFDTDKIE